jgi:hypothetical protein
MAHIVLFQNEYLTAIYPIHEYSHPHKKISDVIHFSATQPQKSPCRCAMQQYRGIFANEWGDKRT